MSIHCIYLFKDLSFIAVFMAGAVLLSNADIAPGSMYLVQATTTVFCTDVDIQFLLFGFKKEMSKKCWIDGEMYTYKPVYSLVVDCTIIDLLCEMGNSHADAIVLV